MQYRTIGSSDLSVSVISFGAWAIGGSMWGGTDDEAAIRAIRKSIDLGVTSIDTAAIYGMGHSERLVGKAIAGRREGLVIATKCGLRWDIEDGAFFFYNDLRDNAADLYKQAIAAKSDDQELADVQAEFDELILGLPNTLHDSVPDGRDENDNLELRRWGTPRVFDFAPLDHVAVGEQLALMDFEAAGRISGARFVVLKGGIARLHREAAFLGPRGNGEMHRRADARHAQHFRAAPRDRADVALAQVVRLHHGTRRFLDLCARPRHFVVEQAGGVDEAGAVG
jgi:hypothetical protein